MEEIEQIFNWPNVQIHHFYIYLLITALIAVYLTYSSKSKYKLELFFLSFYLLSGNLNKLLTFKIPGISLFEIKPIRLIFFLFLFFIIRRTALSNRDYNLSLNGKIPWFQVALISYIIFLILSLLYNISEVGVSSVVKIIMDAIAFLVIVVALQLMADKPSYDLIGKSIILGAVISSIISIMQITVDPYFLRIGDNRSAFGNFIRSNGIFQTEYYNSYFLITAVGWVLITIRRNWLKIGLVVLFSIGVLTSFQRMSWLILTLVIFTYLLFIRKLLIEKLIFLSLLSATILLSVSVLYYKEIKGSSLVQERLNDSIDGRKGYYQFVLNNIGKKPFFGYGDLKSETYYVNMLRITHSRERASAESGDLHSGYFSALYLYGLPAAVSFILFIILSVVYYAKSYRENIFFAIPFIVSIIYMIGNLTNTFLFLKYISILFAIHIGIGLGINQIKEKLSHYDE